MREQKTSTERLHSKVINAEAKQTGVILTLTSCQFCVLQKIIDLSFVICKTGRIVPIPLRCSEEQIN